MPLAKAAGTLVHLLQAGFQLRWMTADDISRAAAAAERAAQAAADAESEQSAAGLKEARVLLLAAAADVAKATKVLAQKAAGADEAHKAACLLAEASAQTAAGAVEAQQATEATAQDAAGAEAKAAKPAAGRKSAKAMLLAAAGRMSEKALLLAASGPRSARAAAGPIPDKAAAGSNTVLAADADSTSAAAELLSALQHSLPALVYLLRTGLDETAQAHAAFVLSHLHLQHSALAIAPSVLADCTAATAQLLLGDSRYARHVAAQCLPRLLSTRQPQALAGATSGLLKVLGSSSRPNAHVAAARSLSSLGHSIKGAAEGQFIGAAIRRSGRGMAGLLRMIDSNDQVLQEDALHALRSIATRSAPDAAQAVSEVPGCLDLLVDIASKGRSSAPALQESAMFTLHNLACSSRSALQAIAAVPGCLHSMAVLLVYGSSASLQRHAGGILCVVSCHKKTVAALSAIPGFMPSLLDMLASQQASTAVHATAADLLSNIIAAPAGMPAVLQVMASGNSEQRVSAAAALRSAIKDEQAAKVIWSDEQLPAVLIRLLQDSNSSVVRAATAAIRDVWRDKHALQQTPLLAAVPGVLSTLISVLDSSSAELQGEAARTLAQLCRGAGVAGSLASVPTYPDRILQMLSSGKPCAQCGAAAALCHLWPFLSTAAVPGTSSRLVELLSSPDKEVPQWAGQALIALTVHDHAQAAVLGTDDVCLDGLTLMLKEERSTGVQDASARMLEALAYGNSAAQAAIAAAPNCMHRLIGLLSSPSDQVKMAAAVMLGSITRDHKEVQWLAGKVNWCISRLTNMLVSSNSKVVRSAVTALVALTQSGENTGVVLSDRCQEQLLRVGHTSKDRTVRALAALPLPHQQRGEVCMYAPQQPCGLPQASMADATGRVWGEPPATRSGAFIKVAE